MTVHELSTYRVTVQSACLMENGESILANVGQLIVVLKKHFQTPGQWANGLSTYVVMLPEGTVARLSWWVLDKNDPDEGFSQRFELCED